MPRLLTRIVALILVPCLAGNALVPAGAATFKNWDAALTADHVSAFETQALTLTLAASLFAGLGLNPKHMPPFVPATAEVRTYASKKRSRKPNPSSPVRRMDDVHGGGRQSSPAVIPNFLARLIR